MKPQSVLVTATAFTSIRPVGLKTGIHFPKHARPAGWPIKLRSPLPAEAKLVEPMSRRNRGDEDAEGKQRSGPGFLVEQAAGKPENIDGEFAVCAVLAMDNAPTRAQALKIFFHGAGPRDLSVRESDTGVSDSHTLSVVPLTHTQVPGARTVEEYFQGLRAGHCEFR